MKEEREHSVFREAIFLFTLCTVFTVCMGVITYNVGMGIASYPERDIKGKPVSEIFKDNTILGYVPTENSYSALNSYQGLKTDNYTITLSDGFALKENQNKPLCTYVNIENNSQNDLIFDKDNFSSDFNDDSSTRSDDLKTTTIFDGSNQELSEVTVKPEEEEIFILCRDSNKGKGVKTSKWSLKSDGNNTISQWVVNYDRTLDVRVLD